MVPPGERRSLDARRASRVVDVQRQAGLSLVASALFAIAAVVVALVPHSTGSWLPLHLFLVGGLLCAISGATQMLAVTWSNAAAPADVIAWVQRLAVVSGTVAVALGRESETRWLIVCGALALVGALVGLGGILLSIRRRGSTDRFHPAIDAYLMAILWGVGGVVLGIVVATTSGSWWERLRSAHLAINMFGLVGLVIAGTLPFFTATQARLKMSRRATPRRVRCAMALLCTSVAVVVLGDLSGTELLIAAGFVSYALGLGGIVLLVPRPGQRQFDWAGARLVQLFTGVAWWILCCLLLSADSVSDVMPDPAVVVRVLAVGGFAQILAASLAYLGPVIRGGGHRNLSAGFAVTRSWVGLVAGNVAAGALLAQWSVVAGVAVAAWVTDAAARGIRLTAGRRTQHADR